MKFKIFFLPNKEYPQSIPPPTIYNVPVADFESVEYLLKGFNPNSKMDQAKWALYIFRKSNFSSAKEFILQTTILDGNVTAAVTDTDFIHRDDLQVCKTCTNCEPVYETRDFYSSPFPELQIESFNFNFVDYSAIMRGGLDTSAEDAYQFGFLAFSAVMADTIITVSPPVENIAFNISSFSGTMAEALIVTQENDNYQFGALGFSGTMAPALITTNVPEENIFFGISEYTATLYQ